MGNPTTFSNLRVKPFDASTATLTLDPRTHAGRTIELSIAATQTITLPAATGTGDVYNIVCSITATGDKVINAAGSDIMGGTAIVTTDASGIVVPTVASTTATVTLNGSTKGGIIGSQVVLTDVASGVWAVSCMLPSTGVEATPFS